MDGMYPDNLNKKPEARESGPSPGFAPDRPPEDQDLYLPPSQRSKPKWRKLAGKTVKIVLIILIVTATAAGVYVTFFHTKKVNPEASKAPARNTQTADAFTAKTTDYTSENAGLTFAYPQTWRVADDAGKLTVSSPIAQLADSSGQQFSGRLVFTVQPKGTELKAFANGGVISARASQKIAYAKPTPVQRGQTYLTFLQYTQSQVKGRLDAIFVTGDFGYQANQYVPKTDIAKLDPLITLTFQKCDDTACANPADASIQSDMWAGNAGFQKTIETMLKSIQVDS